jgi:hypothetical protein
MTPPAKFDLTRVPKVGTLWIWGIESPHGRQLVKVDEVFWNGEEWWVDCRVLAGSVPIGEQNFIDESGVYGNELDRFWEAATPVGGRVDDLCEARW